MPRFAFRLLTHTATRLKPLAGTVAARPSAPAMRRALLASAAIAVLAVPAIERTMRHADWHDQIAAHNFEGRSATPGIDPMTTAATSVFAQESQGQSQTAADVPPPAPRGQANPDEIDLSALRYFAETGDTRRLQIEIARLQALYPDWTPPADPTDIPPPTDEQLQAIWDLYAEGRYAEARAAIAERQRTEPGWQPPADLTERLMIAEARTRLVNASDAEQYQSVVEIAAATPELLTCQEVDVMWRLAEAFALTERPERARDAYLYVATNCDDMDERYATVQKALDYLPRPLFEEVLAAAQSRADDPNAFREIVDEATRRLIIAAQDDFDIRVDEEQIARLERSAIENESVDDAQLLGWHNLRIGSYGEAEAWFRFAAERENSANIAKGLSIALLEQGVLEEAEDVMYPWRYESGEEVAVYLAITSNLVGADPMIVMFEDVLWRMADVAYGAQDPEPAQQFGWYAREFGQHDTAADWFRSILAWDPNHEPSAYGLALSYLALGNSSGLAEVKRLWEGRSERIARVGVFENPDTEPPRTRDRVPTLRVIAPEYFQPLNQPSQPVTMASRERALDEYYETLDLRREINNERTRERQRFIREERGLAPMSRSPRDSGNYIDGPMSFDADMRLDTRSDTAGGTIRLVRSYEPADTYARSEKETYLAAAAGRDMNGDTGEARIQKVQMSGQTNDAMSQRQQNYRMLQERARQNRQAAGQDPYGVPARSSRGPTFDLSRYQGATFEGPTTGNRRILPSSAQENGRIIGNPPAQGSEAPPSSTQRAPTRQPQGNLSRGSGGGGDGTMIVNEPVNPGRTTNTYRSSSQGSAPATTRSYAPSASAQRARSASCAYTTDPGRLSPASALQAGWCLLDLDRPINAVSAFERAAQSSSSSTRKDAVYGLSLAYLRAGLVNEAAIAANRVDHSPARRTELEAALLSNRAVAAYENARYGEAIAYLNRRQQYTPEPADLMVLRGYAYLNMGRRGDAQQVFQALAQTGNPEARKALGEIRQAKSQRP